MTREPDPDNAGGGIAYHQNQNPSSPEGFLFWSFLAEAPPPPEPDLPVYRVESDPREFSISHTPEGWRVSGVSIERAAKMTYWEYGQSIRRFQRILRALGIDEALREAGVQEGDTVLIDTHELEWED